MNPAETYLSHSAVPKRHMETQTHAQNHHGNFFAVRMEIFYANSLFYSGKQEGILYASVLVLNFFDSNTLSLNFAGILQGLIAFPIQSIQRF